MLFFLKLICLLSILDDCFYALYCFIDITFDDVFLTDFDELFHYLVNCYYAKYSGTFYRSKVKVVQTFLCYNDSMQYVFAIIFNMILTEVKNPN
jgi:hypothetical protein